MSSVAHPDWPEERTERLRVLWDEGLSCSKIARILGEGLTRNAVIGKAGRIGLPGRNAGDALRAFNKREKVSKPKPLSLPKPPAPPRSTTHDPEPIGPWCDIPENGCCRYIHGELGQAWRCCGYPTARRDFPWCSFHVKIVYAAQPKRSEAA